MKKTQRDYLNIGKTLALVTQVGISAVIPIGLCMLGANFLIEKFQLGNWVMIMGILLGIGAGFLNIYKMLQSFYKKK